MDRWIVNILCVGLVTGFVTVVLAAPGARASGDAGWLAPVFLETDDTGSATNPKIAVDESGAAIAVWQQFDGSRDNIVTNRFLPGAGWGAPVTVEAKPGWASEPKIAVDRSGDAIAIWSQEDGLQYNVWANRYASGWGWEGPVLIETTANDAIELDVSVDPAGNGVAVWAQWSGVTSIFNIWTNRYELGTGWGTATTVDVLPGTARVPQVVMDSTGIATVVWAQEDSGWSNIYAARYIPGSGWATPTVIETSPGYANYPNLAEDPQGNVTVVWAQNDPGWNSIFSNRYTVGVGWGTAERIETASTDAIFARVAADVDGNAVSVWQQSDGTRWHIWANRCLKRAGWGTASQLDALTAGNGAELPQVAVDSRGNAIAVWREPDPVRYNIWSSRFRPQGGWDPAILIETDDVADASAPDVSLDPIGNAIAVWAQSDGIRFNIRANRYIADASPPTLTVTSPTEDLTRNAVVPVAGWTHPGSSVTVNGINAPVSGTGHFELPLTLAEGPNLVSVKATDADSNVAIWTHSITRDSKAPAIALTEPVNGATFRTSAVRVSGSVDDSGSGVSELSVNGLLLVPTLSWSVDLAFPDGTRTIVASARDVAGNVNSTSVTVIVNTGLVTLVLTSPTTDLTRQATVTVSGITEVGATMTVNGDPVPVNPNGSFSTVVSLAEGPNTITVVATDPQGNTAQVVKSVTLDTTAPSVAVMSPLDGVRVNTTVVHVSGTASDVGSGLAGLSVNGVLLAPSGAWNADIPFADGTHTITATAEDLAGNTAMRTLTVTIDTVAPILLVTNPVAELTNAASIPVAGATEPGASLTVNAVPVNVASSGSFATSVNLVEGANTILVRALDPAGNVATVSRSVIRDSSVPFLAVDVPTDNALIGGPVYVAGRADQGTTAVVHGTVVSLTVGVAWATNHTLPDRTHRVYVSAADKAGNVASASLTVVFDTVPPGLTLTTPENRLTNAATTNVAGFTEPGAAVTINGVPTSVSASGAFSMT